MRGRLSRRVRMVMGLGDGKIGLPAYGKRVVARR
jgi:hypothetical protein